MNELSRYPVQVFWSDEDQGFIGIAPDLPGCSAFGETEGQCLVEIRDAIAAWIDAARAAKNSVPPPSAHDRDLEDFSGRFLLRLPRTLHASLTRRAKDERVSLNQCVIFLLTEALTKATYSASADFQPVIRFTAKDSRTAKGLLAATLFNKSAATKGFVSTHGVDNLSAGMVYMASTKPTLSMYGDEDFDCGERGCASSSSMKFIPQMVEKFNA